MRSNAPLSKAGTGPAVFTISVDGKVIGTTARVMSKDHKGSGAGNGLLAHELTHIVQNRAAGSKGPRQITLGKIELEGGAFSGKGAALQTARGKRVRIATGRNGGVEFTAQSAQNDVLQHEWTLTYEAIQRVM